MKEEIFGPVLPIITFKDFDKVVEHNIKKRDKPLAIYYFGLNSSKNYQRILNSTSSGACVTNDILTQTVETDLGFGGVGGSGMGRYGGYEGFKQWSNPKAVVEKWQLNFPPYTMLAPPYDGFKQKFMSTLVNGLFIKQNCVLCSICSFVFFVYAYFWAFTDYGDGVYRKVIAQALIDLLKNWL